MATESSVLVRLRLLGGQAFARGAQQAGRGLGSIGSEGTRATRGIRGINAALGVAGAAMRTVAAGGAVALGAGLAYGVKASAGFEQSMANVQARLLTTKGNMKLLEAQALDLGARTQFSARQASDAMGEFAAAGFSTKQIMGLMPGTLNLAAASGEDLATTAELQGAMMRQFGLHARDAGHVADVLTTAVNKSAIGMDDLGLTMKYVGPVAGRFNQSIEDIGGAAAILGNVGIKGETAGTTLRRAFVNLVKPSGKTMDMLAGMGITTGEFAKATVNAQGDLRPFPQMLGNLAGHFEDLTKPEQRRALAQLFGVEALPGLLTLFGKGEKGIRKMSDQLRNSGGAAERTAGIMRNTVKGAWDNFTGSVETAAITLTKRFNPAIRDTLNAGARGVNTAVKRVTDFAAGATGGGKRPAAPKRTALGQAGARPDVAPASGAENAGAMLKSKLEPVFNWVKAEAPKIGQALLGAGRDLLAAFAPAMPFIQNVVLPLLKGIAVGILGGVVFAFKLAVPIIKVLATILGFIGRAAAPLKPVFYGIGVVIGSIAGGPILGLLGKLKYLGIVFRILAIPIRVATGLVRAVGRGVGLLAFALGAAVRGALRFAGAFLSLPGRVLGAAVRIVGSIVKTIGGLGAKIAGIAIRAGGRLISGLANGVRSGIGRLVSFMGRVGKSMLDAVVNAIKAAPGALFNAFKAILPGGKVGKAVGNFLGLQSGGVVSGSGWAVVGERGPELAHLPRGSEVYDSGQTRRARASMAGAAPIVVTANLHMSGKQIHSEVFRVDRTMAEAT